MSLYDSPSCLSIFNRKAGRPATDAITDPSKYLRLSESQNRVVAMASAVTPKSFWPTVAYGALPTLTTTDNQIFTFGTVLAPITPIGKVGIYRSLNDIPDYPMREGIDFLWDGGTSIRIPNNSTYSGTLYWLGVTPPPDMTALVDPVLQPLASRELIVIDAVRQFATEGNRNPDLAALMAAEWAVAWPQWCLAWKTAFRLGGALGSFSGMQMALSQQFTS